MGERVWVLKLTARQFFMRPEPPPASSGCCTHVLGPAQLQEGLRQVAVQRGQELQALPLLRELHAAAALRQAPRAGGDALLIGPRCARCIPRPQQGIAPLLGAARRGVGLAARGRRERGRAAGGAPPAAAVPGEPAAGVVVCVAARLPPRGHVLGGVQDLIVLELRLPDGGSVRGSSWRLGARRGVCF